MELNHSLNFNLKDIIFRKNEISGENEKLCPDCFVFNLLDSKRCDHCGEEIKNYDESQFLAFRVKHVDELKSEKNEISLSSNSDFNTTDLNEKFKSQILKVGPILKFAEFVNKYSISKIPVNDLIRSFLFQFPFNQSYLNQFADLDINVDIKTEKASLIFSTLQEIENKGFLEIIKNFSFWVKNYSNSFLDSAVTQNLEWLKVAYGYYNGPYGSQINVNEDDMNDITKAQNAIFSIKTPYEIELALSPLHWSFILEEHSKENNKKPRISKKRYEVLLKQLVPTDRYQKKWKQLGLAYCSDAPQALISSEHTEYFNQQLLLPFEKRDTNFVLSYVLISLSKGEYINSEKMFSYVPTEKLMDSYYSPLVSLFSEPAVLQKYLYDFTDKESFLRTIRIVSEFRKEIDLTFVLKKWLPLLPEADLYFLIKAGNSKLNSVLFFNLITENKPDVLKKVMNSRPIQWPEDVSKEILQKLSKENLKVFIESLSFVKGIGAKDLMFVLDDETTSNDLLKEFLFQMRRNDIETVNPFLIFNQWVKYSKTKQPEKAEIIFDEIGMFLRGSIVFSSMTLKEKFKDLSDSFVDSFYGFLTSTEPESQKMAETIIQKFFEVRGAKLFQFNNFSYDLIFSSIVRMYLQTNDPLVAAFCNTVVRDFIFEKKVNDGLILDFWKKHEQISLSDQRSEMNHLLKNQTCIKNLIVLESSPSKNNDSELELKKAQKELEEIKKKLQQSEKLEAEKKRYEERDRLIAEAQQKAQKKAQQYQVKSSEIQMWFQIESAKLMASADAPMEKSSKMTALSGEYQKKLQELAQWMTNPDT